MLKKFFLNFDASRIAHVLIVVIGLVAINVIASRFFLRFDVTGEKIFTLSDGTRRILEKLGDDEISSKLFFSRSSKDVPVLFKTYATRVEEVLREYAGHSGGKLRVEVIDPRPDTDEEEWARKYGIQGVRVPSGEEIFFGVVFVRGAQESPVPYLDPRREEFLESDLSMALVNVTRTGKARIGVVSGIPGFFSGASSPMEQGSSWVVLQELRRLFEVEEITSEASTIDPALKLVLVVHPKDLNEKTEYAIDQFVVGGGRLVVLVDPMSRTDLMNAGPNMGQLPRVSSDLPRLFAAWGVDYSPQEMVGDLAQQTQINAGGMGLAYPYFISLGKDSFGKDSVISGSLGQMMFAEGGFLKLKDGSSSSFTPLIETSESAGTVSASMAAFTQPQDMVRQFKPKGGKLTLAALYRGKFKSAFTAAPAGASGYKAEAESENSVVVVADVDFLADHNSVEKMQFINQVMIRPRNDNMALVLNAVDVLSGSEDLVSIRSRGKIHRPFTRVAALQEQAQKKWQKEEEELSARLQELQTKLNELQKQRSEGSRFGLSPEQQREIAAFRSEEQMLRKRRREVRRNLREDIEALGNRLVFANMVVVPLAVAGFGVGVFVQRSRRRRATMEVQ
jgi:ABC-type uncharacterized transport system involved in gliding motility auxiliary subunit